MPKPDKNLEEVVAEQAPEIPNDLAAAKVTTELVQRVRRYPKKHFERMLEVSEVFGLEQAAEETRALIDFHDALTAIELKYSPPPPEPVEEVPEEVPIDNNVGKPIDISAGKPVQPDDSPVPIAEVKQQDTELKGPKPPSPEQKRDL